MVPGAQKDEFEASEAVPQSSDTDLPSLGVSPLLRSCHGSNGVEWRRDILAEGLIL